MATPGKKATKRKATPRTLAEGMDGISPVEVVLPGAHTEAWVLDQTRYAQEFLESARETVENALTASSTLRTIRRVHEGKQLRGRYSQAEQDLLRAALVFAGAGLESALQRLVGDALAAVVEVDAKAAEALQKHAQETIRGVESGLDTKTLVTIFLSTSPRDAAVTSLKDKLCRDSLQSPERVNDVATALGIVDPGFRKRIATDKDTLLRAMFDARNDIVHELDLEDPGKRPKKPLAERRRRRALKHVKDWVTEALTVTQLIINEVATRLRPPADV